MAKKIEHKMTEREVEIGQAIRGLCTRISDDLTSMADAKEAKDAASDAEQKGRLPVILDIAKLSADENWTEAEAVWGCEYAAAVKGNDDRIAKTIQTFCSDMKSVASPKVRDQVPVIFDACTLAWEAESLAIKEDKAAPRPLRAFAKRQYHLIVRAIKEQRVGQILIETPADVVAWAEANNPALNADKVAELVADMAEKLHGFFVSFAHPDLQTAETLLEGLTAKAIEATRTRPDMRNTLPKPKPVTVASTPAPQAAQKPAEAPRPVPVVVTPATPAPAPTPVEPEPVGAEVSEGVYDFMDNVDAAQLAAD